MSKAKKLVLNTTLVSSVLVSGMAMAEIEGLSGNVGLVSEYFYRGVAQLTSTDSNGDAATSATASAGLDYEIGNGFSVGVWSADVGDGLEVDVYGSYGGEFNGFSYSIGATGYYYTGQFDSKYEEINLNIGYGPINLEHSRGNWDNELGLGDFQATPPGDQGDYTITAISGEYNGFHALFGAWGDDADGNWWEIGYGREFGGFDVDVTYLNGDEVDTENNWTTDTTSLIFSISKSFDL
ncbi:MAG: TorF family putative porin [Gammaproteobacteria bacterium]|nr:TorF family putative porin [Gammaproteobacteria bacterium]